MPNTKKSRESKGSKGSKTSSRSVMGTLMPPVDIDDVSKLNELDKRISIGPVLVFIYADWCNYCQKFKPKMEELENDPNRSIQTVRIRDDMFPKSSLNTTKITSYPTLMLLNEGQPVVFKDKDGKVAPAIPDYTNMAQMKSIVRNAGTPAAKEILEGKEPANTILKMGPLTPVSTNLSQGPPDIIADRLSASTVNQLNTNLMNSSVALKQQSNNPMQLGGGQMGGSLWSQLMLASKDVAPAAALFLGASLFNTPKQGSKTRKQKGTKRKTRRLKN